MARTGVSKRGSCHIFRHAMATLMHENGADIRHLQHQLGHADMSTTAIYTHVSVQKLKQVHDATHPAEARPRQSSAIFDGNGPGSRYDPIDE